MPIHGARDSRNRYCALGTIDYKCVDGDSAHNGTILYIKACLNGSEPTDVLHYASFDPAFPQQGTEQLWFDESQFESYRRLGAHIVEKICEAAPALVSGSAVQGFIEAARTFIGPKPALRSVGWPISPGFGGSIRGAFKDNLELTVNVQQV